MNPVRGFRATRETAHIGFCAVRRIEIPGNGPLVDAALGVNFRWVLTFRKGGGEPKETEGSPSHPPINRFNQYVPVLRAELARAIY